MIGGDVFVIEIIYKSKGNNITGDRIYAGCILLEEGKFADSASKMSIFYDGKVLKRDAGKWLSNYVSINHSNDILDRIGYVENPRWANNKLLADIRIIPVTSRAKDVISLLDNNMAQDLSIEALTEEEYDKDLKCLRLTTISFTGLSIVTQGACGSARVNT